MIAALKSHLRQSRPPPWLVRLLPGDSRSFGPPRRWSRALDLPASRASVTPLDLERVRLAEPRWLNAPKTDWLGLPLPSPLPPAFVIRAPEARLLANDGAVVLANDTWVVDCGFYPWNDDREGFRYHQLVKRRRAPALRRLRGRTLSLAGDFCAFSYGHWLLDSITRWGLVEAAGIDPAEFDHVYLPCPGPVARRIAASLPFPADKLLLDHSRADLLCDELVATSHPGWPGFVPAFAGRVLAGRAPAPSRPPDRARIAILRDGFTRNLSNRVELYALLTARGFTLLDPRTDQDIPAWCAQARVIVSIEGSQAYDLLFAPRGARALIITSPHHRTFPYPQSAAAAAGLELFMLAGQPDATTPSGHETDFILPPDVFSHALDVVLDNEPS